MKSSAEYIDSCWAMTPTALTSAGKKGWVLAEVALSGLTLQQQVYEQQYTTNFFCVHQFRRLMSAFMLFLAGSYCLRTPLRVASTILLLCLSMLSGQALQHLFIATPPRWECRMRSRSAFSNIRVLRSHVFCELLF